MTVRLTRPGDDALAESECERLAQRADRVLELVDRREAELSLVLVDDEQMARLNAEWRGSEGPTDVLSFSLAEGDHAEHRGPMLGDVVIGVEVAKRQAREIGHSLADELLRLLVHGVLHLLGHDHEQEDEARVMQAEEARVLAGLAS